jgi:hypothetical protein
MGWYELVWSSKNRDQWRALVNTVMNLRVPQNVGKFLSSCTTGGFSRRAQLHEVIDLRVKFVLSNAASKVGVSHPFTRGRQLFSIKSTIFWDRTQCIPLKVNRCFWGKYRPHLQGRISRVDSSVKASGNSNNRLGGNFGLYSKQGGNGRMDLNSHWLAVEQNETAGLSYDHRANQ